MGFLGWIMGGILFIGEVEDNDLILLEILYCNIFYFLIKGYNGILENWGYLLKEILREIL